MTYQDLITEINSKLCDQETGEPTGLNQFFDSLIQIKESVVNLCDEYQSRPDVVNISSILESVNTICKLVNKL
jgi:hypothetical protein